MSDGKWNLEMVKAREAFAMLPRIPGQDDRIDWGDIDVAHIDTGITKHSVFGFDASGNSEFVDVASGRNYVDAENAPLDPCNYVGVPAHGTRTSSVLCGNLPGTFMGVAPGLKIIPYRVVNHVVPSSKKSRMRIAHAIEHAVNRNGCEVISISLGTPVVNVFSTRHLGRMVDQAYDEGIIVVAAGGQVIDRVTYPGKFFRTIGVGGVRRDRTVWFEYEEGDTVEWIDIWAPSDDIRRANSRFFDGEVREAEFTAGDGTSYGTAHVAAAAAMWLAYHGSKLDTEYQQPWQRIEAFRLLLESTSSKIAGDYWPNEPKGILDIEKLLTAKLPDPGSLKREERKAENQFM